MTSHHLMYHASVPVFSAMLKNLASCLTIGETNARERGIDEQVYLTSRLAPDMFTLTRQVQIATDTAKGAAYRLAGREVPAMADTEASFAELLARIETIRTMLDGFKPEEFDGSELREVTMRMRSGEMKFVGGTYLNRVALPNFYFHTTTAYSILRHNGVPLGKPDFLGNR